MTRVIIVDGVFRIRCSVSIVYDDYVSSGPVRWFFFYSLCFLLFPQRSDSSNFKIPLEVTNGLGFFILD